MKKLISLLLVVFFLLTGCQVPIEEATSEATVPEISEPLDIETSVPTEDEIIVTEPIIYEQQTMLAVSMPLIYDSVCDESGNTIFCHTYQNMQLIAPDPEVANRIIVDYLNRMDEMHTIAGDFSIEAKSQYINADNWQHYSYDVLYSPMRIDQEVLSLYGVSTSYTGSRPVQVCSAINYSMLTGEVLTLGSILKHIDAKAQLVDLTVQKATEIKDEKQLFEDYADCIAERFEREESFDEDWYFSNRGLCFFFSAYEIAPYSAGIVTLEIPYQELTGVIHDSFFPPEEDKMIGCIQAQLMDNTDLTEYTQIAEIILSDVGEKVFLSVQGAILDVCIETGSWNMDGTKFNPACTVFTCNSLTPGDGIMIQTDIPDAMPNIRITYQSNDESMTVFLSQSGMDGSILLIEPLQANI